MRIYVLTDQEGVAGVVSSTDYAAPDARYYETARRLLTLEVNAAVDGAFDGGASEIFVLDGHGHGSIDVELLHPEACVLTGRPIRFPFDFDASFDALMFVGQHAKSNTDGGHLSHTGSMNQEDLLLNRVSLGELGWYMQLAGYYGKPTILVTGDQAACDEALALEPAVEVAAVKRGIRNGPASGLPADTHRLHNEAAIHRSPAKARAMIRTAAERAVRRAGSIPPFFMPPPYELVSIVRADAPAGRPRVAILRADDFLTLGEMPRDHRLTLEDIPFPLANVS